MTTSPRQRPQKENAASQEESPQRQRERHERGLKEIEEFKEERKRHWRPDKWDHDGAWEYMTDLHPRIVKPFEDAKEQVLEAIRKKEAAQASLPFKVYGKWLDEDRQVIKALQHLEQQARTGDKDAGKCVVEIAKARMFIGGGRPEGTKTTDKTQREQNTDAQRAYSSRKYQAKFQEKFRNGEAALKKQGKGTEQWLRHLKDRIIASEKTPHTGQVKRQALDAFAQWAETEIVHLTTMRKNSR